MPNVMAAILNIGGALYEISVIHSLYNDAKFYMSSYCSSAVQ